MPDNNKCYNRNSEVKIVTGYYFNYGDQGRPFCGGYISVQTWKQEGTRHESTQENTVPEKSSLDIETVEENWLASTYYRGNLLSNWNVSFY